MKNFKLISPCVSLFLWNVVYYDAVVYSSTKPNSEAMFPTSHTLLAKLINKADWPPFSIFGNAQAMLSIFKYLDYKATGYSVDKDAINIGEDAVNLLRDKFNVKLKSLDDFMKIQRSAETIMLKRREQNNIAATRSVNGFNQTKRARGLALPLLVLTELLIKNRQQQQEKQQKVVAKPRQLPQLAPMSYPGYPPGYYLPPVVAYPRGTTSIHHHHAPSKSSSNKKKYVIVNAVRKPPTEVRIVSMKRGSRRPSDVSSRIYVDH